MKKLFLFCLVFVVLLSGCVLNLNAMKVIVVSENDDYKFNVTVADSYDERTRGLQEVTELSDKDGMWFVFDEPRSLNFWMKDTLISLDIIFVNSDLEIVNIANNVPPCQDEDPEQINCENYHSSLPAQYVLEIRGGLAEELGIKPGDKIIPPKYD